METRVSWVPHGKLGYYVGLEIHHYRWYKVYLPSVRKFLIADLIQQTEYKKIETPHKSSKNNFLDAVQELKDLVEEDPMLSVHNSKTRAISVDIRPSIVTKKNTYHLEL